jgi:hypothetical protein
MRHLGQGKDIAGCELVPDIPRARGAEVFFLVDLGCRECAPVWSARHGISVLVGRCLVFDNGCVGSGKPGKCSMRDARAVTFSPIPAGWEWEEALGASVGWRS